MNLLQLLIKDISSAKDTAGAISAALNGVKNVINCQHGTLYVFKDNFLGKKIDKYDFNVHKTIIEGKYIDVVSANDT